MCPDISTQKVRKKTSNRINDLNIAKRGLSFDDIVNILIDEHEKKKKK
jgi:hypothetical protein